MTPEQMLETLNSHGEDAASDYNDGEDVEGWYGWKVADGVLTVTYRSADGSVASHTEDTASWRLVPIGGQS